MALANFSETTQFVSHNRLRDLDFGGTLVNQLNEQILLRNEDIRLEPYEVVWLQQVG